MNEVSGTENAKAYLEHILSLLEIEGSVTQETFDESTVCYRIECDEKNAKMLIGRKGTVLEALQFVLRQMCKGGEPEEQHFIIDVMDYRQRRKESILDRAKRAAVGVLNGDYEDVALPPMNAFERRLVHNYLHEHFPDLLSESYGSGPDRHIVVSYGGEPDGSQQAAEEPAEGE